MVAAGGGSHGMNPSMDRRARRGMHPISLMIPEAQTQGAGLVSLKELGSQGVLHTISFHLISSHRRYFSFLSLR
jgi:hypothetical protein